MARAATETLLSLDQWAQIMGINPWEFNQIGKDLPVENTAQCQSVWFQHPWQKDFISREEVAQAIDSAERAIANQTKFWPAPRYITDELVHPRRPRDWNMPSVLSMDGRWKPITTQWTRIRQAGILARTIINATAAIVLSDKDGDSFNETFTISVASATPLVVDEIGVYIKASDRLGNPIDETWRIRPVKVTISGVNITIVGHISQLVLPSLEEQYDVAELSATGAIYITQAEVYRVFTDITATTAAPNQGLGSWDIPADSTPDGTVSISPIYMVNDDADSGTARIQIISTNAPYVWGPDRLHINYLAGLPLVNGKVHSMWAKAIAYLAVAFLPSDKCGCERSNFILRWWRLLPSQSNEGARPLTLHEIDDNPFGNPRRGSRFAWQFVKEEIGDGVLY